MMSFTINLTNCIFSIDGINEHNKDKFLKITKQKISSVHLTPSPWQDTFHEWNYYAAG